MGFKPSACSRSKLLKGFPYGNQFKFERNSNLRHLFSARRLNASKLLSIQSSLAQALNLSRE